MSYNERINAALNVALRRQYSTPLDVSSVFNSLADFEAYVKQNTTYAPEGYSDEDKAFLQKINPYSYVGQVVAVIQGSEVKTYVITSVGADGTYKEVGSLPVGDDQSIEVKDGKIQLVGFGDATDGAVAQIEVAEDGTKTLVWAPIASRVTALEGTTPADGGIVGAVKTVEYEPTTGVFTFKDSKGNLINTVNLAIEKVVTNFAYHATYPGKDGKTYDNVLVLTLGDGEEQIVEIEDLINIYEGEKNPTEVQITIAPSTESTDPNDPSSDHPNVISAKLTDSVKADIGKGVVAHEGLSHSQSDVELNYSEGLGEHRVLLKDSVKADITKGVTAHNAIFDGTTTFVLNGGNASGYTVATDESTEV